MIALAEASVLSEPDTEVISVSKTPDFKLSTSMLDTVLLSTSIVLFVNDLVVFFYLLYVFR